jgi:hypothetical protein
MRMKLKWSHSPSAAIAVFEKNNKKHIIRVRKLKPPFNNPENKTVFFMTIDGTCLKYEQKTHHGSLKDAEREALRVLSA